jgi:hypothetical protein
VLKKTQKISQNIFYIKKTYIFLPRYFVTNKNVRKNEMCKKQKIEVLTDNLSVITNQ